MNERFTVPEAARRLGISEGALRQRINRGTIEHEKDADGRVYVFIRHAYDEQHTEQYGDLTQVVEILRDQVEHLRRQLDEERAANRENRRLLAAAFERIPPQLEPPQEASSGPRDASETAAETSGKGAAGPLEPQEPSERRSWWQRFFGSR